MGGFFFLSSLLLDALAHALDRQPARFALDAPRWTEPPWAEWPEDSCCSLVEGFGYDGIQLVATRDIARGEFITWYADPSLCYWRTRTHAPLESYPEHMQADGSVRFGFGITPEMDMFVPGDLRVIVAQHKGWAAGHSINPKAAFVIRSEELGWVELRAVRAISAWDEIWVNYNGYLELRDSEGWLDLNEVERRRKLL
jgi:hypothetical protein